MTELEKNIFSNDSEEFVTCSKEKSRVDADLESSPEISPLVHLFANSAGSDCINRYVITNFHEGDILVLQSTVLMFLSERHTQPTPSSKYRPLFWELNIKKFFSYKEILFPVQVHDDDRWILISLTPKCK